jgi:hypothetical protein
MFFFCVCLVFVWGNRECVFSIIILCRKNKWKRAKQSHLMDEIVTDDDDADTGAWATLINPYQANYVYKK